MPAERATVKCELCGIPTPMLGTRRCDRCWELESRITANSQLAAEILAKLPAVTRCDGMPVSSTERQLRRMLCSQRHGSKAYFDDGEASWGGDDSCPAIDYMRMTPEQIRGAWLQAGMHAIVKQQAQAKALVALQPCKSPYCECEVGKCRVSGFYDARGASS